MRYQIKGDNKMRTKRQFDSSYPGGAWWDEATFSYWNQPDGGQELIDIDYYNQYSEGYTPFGDE